MIELNIYIVIKFSINLQFFLMLTDILVKKDREGQNMHVLR